VAFSPWFWNLRDSKQFTKERAWKSQLPGKHYRYGLLAW
jgi:hypothetical protein